MNETKKYAVQIIQNSYNKLGIWPSYFSFFFKIWTLIISQVKVYLNSTFTTTSTDQSASQQSRHRRILLFNENNSSF